MTGLGISATMRVMIESIEKSWLVKANGRVMGPFSKEEIHALLRKKEIVVLNEVISPYRRWQYIRDLDEFSEIVEDLRLQEFGHNEDHTMTTSQTASVTEKLPEHTAGGAGRKSKSEMKEIVIDHVDEIKTQARKSPNANSQYRANVNEDFIEKQSDKFSKSAWFIAIAIVLAVVGFVSTQRLTNSSSPKVMSAEDHFKAALQDYYAGDYELALPNLEKSIQGAPGNTQAQALLVPLSIMFRPEKYNDILKMIESLEKSERPDRERLEIAKALIFLREKKFDQAKETFRKALQVNPFSWQAFSNLGVVAFLEGDFLTAKNNFESALAVEVEDRSTRGEVYLMRAASEIYLWDSLKNEKYLKDAEAGLNALISEYSDYRQEALLLKSFIHFSQNRKPQALTFIEQMLDTDPLLTSEHSKDPYVDRSPIGWTQLLPWCQAIRDAWPDEKLIRTFFAICLIQTKGRDIEAQTEIGVAVSQSPKDPVTHAAFAYITWIMGEESKAEMLATKAVDLNSSLKTLPHIVKARICEKSQNYECAVEQWQAVRALDSSSVSALGGLAFAYLKLKKFSLFETTHYEGEKYSKYYKPLLRSRVLAETEGLKVDRK